MVQQRDDLHGDVFVVGLVLGGVETEGTAVETAEGFKERLMLRR